LDAQEASDPGSIGLAHHVHEETLRWMDERSLTSAEAEVLEYAAHNRERASIAACRGVKESTVKSLTRRVLEKTGFNELARAGNEVFWRAASALCRSYAQRGTGPPADPIYGRTRDPAASTGLVVARASLGLVRARADRRDPPEGAVMPGKRRRP
jgi:DNA-binding CsgD family transcriptional regulator